MRQVEIGLRPPLPRFAPHDMGKTAMRVAGQRGGAPIEEETTLRPPPVYASPLGDFVEQAIEEKAE